MDDLSLHILDIAENSINAEAKNIEILINEDTKNNRLIIEINDDGKGMDEDMAEAIKDPFVTSRTTRNVGLGVPLLKEAAEMAGGNLEIDSKKGVGTKVRAEFQYSNIDRKPLGNMMETILALVASEKDFNIKFSHKVDEQEFEFELEQFKKFAKQLNIDSNNILILLKKYLRENYNNLK